jgi:hypothetical protein
MSFLRTAVVILTAIILPFIAACNSTNGPPPSNPIAAIGDENVEYVVELGQSPAKHPGVGGKPTLSLEPGQTEGEFTLIAEGDDIRVLFATIKFNTDTIHYIGAIVSQSKPAVFAAIPVEPGVLHLGWALLDFDEQPGVTGKNEIVRLRFAPGVRTNEKKASSAPIGEANAVDDLESSWDESGLHFTFFERHPGDYDRDGEVNIADIAQIALNYLATVDRDNPDDPLVAIDGDGNGEVGMPDITTIADNYSRKVSGFTLQFSTNNGATWTPADVGASGIEDSYSVERADENHVMLDQSKAYPVWEVAIPSDELSQLGMPDLDPANPNLAMRVYATDGVTIGLASNDAQIAILETGDTTPPVWLSTVGATSLSPIQDFNVLTVEFGEAHDDESDPVSYRIYCAPTEDFDAALPDLDDDPDAIPFIEYSPKPQQVAPYDVDIVGLSPGVEYKVLARAKDSAFPAPNYDTNTVVASAVVDAHSLQMGEIATDREFPETGDTIRLSVIVAGASEGLRVEWQDNRTDAGYFIGDGTIADGVASTAWGTAIGDVRYRFEALAVDDDGKHGRQRFESYVAGKPALNFTKDIFPLIQQKCIECHDADHSAGLDLSTPQTAYSNLVNSNSAEIADAKRVKPFIVDQSYLVDKIIENSPNRTGSRMPKDGPYLPDEEIDRIKRWVITGAAEGAMDPSALYFGTPSISRIDTNEKVNELPAGVCGVVDAPILSEFTPPLTLSLDLGDGQHGDAFYDPAGVLKEKTLRFNVGGDRATSFGVSATVEDANGKAGSFDVEVALTMEGAEVLSYESDIEPLIVTRCAKCHSAISPVLSQKDGYKSLIRKPSTKPGWNYVTPGSPSKSYVLYKLHGWQPAAPDGKPNPHNIDPANATDVDEFIVLFTNWILGGARP